MDVIERPTLLEIEQHIARLYATGLQLAEVGSSSRSDDLLVQILQDTEATYGIVQRVDPLAFDLDTVLDVAVILSRVVNIWNVSVARWRGEVDCAALAAAAKDLTDAGLALYDALASGPWLAPDDGPLMRSGPRLLQ